MTTSGSGEMTTELTETTIVAYAAALAGSGDPMRFLAPDVTFTAMETGEVTRGLEAVAMLLDHLHRQAFTAAPILRTLVAIPGLAMVEADFVGTHVGEFAGVAATGRSVRVPFAAAFDLVDGFIVAVRAYLPLDALLRQVRGG